MSATKPTLRPGNDRPNLTKPGSRPSFPGLGGGGSGLGGGNRPGSNLPNRPGTGSGGHPGSGGNRPGGGDWNIGDINIGNNVIPIAFLGGTTGAMTFAITGVTIIITTTGSDPIGGMGTKSDSVAGTTVINSTVVRGAIGGRFLRIQAV